MQLQKQNIAKSPFKSQQKKLKYLFDNKKIEQFIRQVQKLQNQKAQISTFALETNKHFKQILQKNQRAIKIMKGPKTQGWKTNKIDQRTELSVKVTGTNVQIRYQGLLLTSIENICVMIYQVNLFNNWVPFCTKGQNLLDKSPLQKICYLQFKLPFLTQRYAYFYALGIDRIDENNTIIIYGEGITENKQALKKYGIPQKSDKTNKMVPLDLKYFICEISYKSETQFYLKCYGELDSHMPILPQWLVNAVIKQLGGLIFAKVIKQSKDIKGSVWEKQMEKGKEKGEVYYEWLHGRIQNWHKKSREEIQRSKM